MRATSSFLFAIAISVLVGSVCAPEQELSLNEKASDDCCGGKGNNGIFGGHYGGAYRSNGSEYFEGGDRGYGGDFYGGGYLSARGFRHGRGGGIDDDYGFGLNHAIGGGLANDYGYGLRTGYGTGGYGDPVLQDQHVCNAREIDRSKCLENYPDSRGVEWRFIENLGWRKFTGLGSARYDWWQWKNTYRPFSSFSDYTWY